uniref:heavy-metal-associated domain-containing protein n=1 Tax=Mesorhizobium comanense TaxID=2502215 RepID=UPI0010F5F45A
MSCGHCASTIEKAVKSVDPAARVAIDLGSSTVAVETKADEAAIRDVIRSAGYDNENLAASSYQARPARIINALAAFIYTEAWYAGPSDRIR